jgi:hypothetical protein
MRKLTLASAAVALCMLAGGASAQAAGKTRVVVENFSEPYELSVDCSPYGPYDFDVLVTGREYVKVTEVLSADGSLLQTVVRGRLLETNTNSVSGAAVELRRSSHEVWDWGEGVRTISGMVWMGTLPGAGAFVQDTGRIILTIDTDEPVFVAGPHEAFFGELDSIVCAELAGGG